MILKFDSRFSRDRAAPQNGGFKLKVEALGGNQHNLSLFFKSKSFSVFKFHSWNSVTDFIFFFFTKDQQQQTLATQILVRIPEHVPHLVHLIHVIVNPVGPAPTVTQHPKPANLILVKMAVHVKCLGEVTAASAHRRMEGQTVKVSKKYKKLMTQASKNDFLKSFSNS